MIQQKKSVFSSSFFFLFIFLASFFLKACGGGIETVPPQPIEGSLTSLAFSLPGPDPTNIVIVDQPELKNTAFVVNYTPPMVLALDLNQNPLQLSTEFKGLEKIPALSSLGGAVGDALRIIDSTHAFLLTLNGLIYFNPKEGSIYKTLLFSEHPLTLSSPLEKRSMEDGSPMGMIGGTVDLTFPQSLGVTRSKVMVSFGNLYAGDRGNEAYPGIIRFFDLLDHDPYLVPSSNPSYIVTHGYNATGITSLGNDKFLATSRGITKLLKSPETGSIPLTNGYLDLIDSQGRILEALDLGLTAPAFLSWAVTQDQKTAFLGSSSGGYVLEVSLNPLRLVHGKDDPIILNSGENGTDYISSVILSRDESKLYAASYNQSTVYTVDLTTPERRRIGEGLNLSLSKSLGVTGISAMSLRPGVPEVDFQGPDFFVLTAKPGALATIKTQSNQK